MNTSLLTEKDIEVRIWEVQSNGMTAGKAMYTHEGPALTCDWSKYWDLRTQNPIGTVQLPERCYTMDVNHPLMVVGTADRHLVVIDLNNPTVPFKSYLSPLKFQTRTVSCFPSKDGFAIGSIEGRVAIQYIQDSAKSNEFSFKCHRDTSNNVFAVNCISHHPLFGTFSTAGSDGNIMFWDKEARQKLKSFPCVNTPITSTCFNRDGRIFAYSVGYDWSKGYAHSNQNDKRTIYLHSVKEDDVKPRKRR
ncbi:Protein RAE1 [Zancudomyces culisetae]|uniref:Protein RAE1 n=1 Tax=Zancudomyces culisetae TaxID=1213189 RepID=A0A1R1PYU4_ZANCU|nr:Protein RAE1 [Zancudomyces culisetae]|eukprot:OMH86138.1 Protein RAE1 [Zancudomyces culisetae]